MNKQEKNKASVEKMRQIRNERYSKGLCCICGKNPHRQGKKSCHACYLRNSPKAKASMHIPSSRENALTKLCLELVSEGVLIPDRLMEALK